MARRKRTREAEPTRRRKRSRGEARGFVVDFSKEEGGGGGVRLPEGDYSAKILKASQTESSEKGTPGLEVTFQITEGKHKGKKIVDRLWNVPKALWRFRSLLEALGMKVPSKAARIPIDKLRGKELGITLTDDEYEGRTRSRVSDFLDLDEMGEEEDEDDLDDEEDEDYDDEEEDEDEEDEDEVEDDELEELDVDEM